MPYIFPAGIHPDRLHPAQRSVPEINIVDELDWIQFQAVKQIREFGNTSGQ